MENGYQESITSIINNHGLCLSQQQMQSTYIQEEEMRMSTNLPYAEGTSRKLRHILGSLPN